MPVPMLSACIPSLAADCCHAAFRKKPAKKLPPSLLWTRKAIPRPAQPSYPCGPFERRKLPLMHRIRALSS